MSYMREKLYSPCFDINDVDADAREVKILLDLVSEEY